MDTPSLRRESRHYHDRPKDVEEFILHHKARGVSNKTIWNYVTDLRALFNWAVKEGLARENPVHKADLDPIRNRRSKKPPLNLENVERAAVRSGSGACLYRFPEVHETQKRRSEPHTLG